MTQNAVMPLHTFMSPNGNGFCVYESLGKVCGLAEVAYLHMAKGERIASHPYVQPKPGTFAEEGGRCGHPLAAGGQCGAVYQDHVRAKVGEVTVPVSGFAEAPVDPVADYLESKGDASYTTHHGAVFPLDSPPTTGQTVAVFFDEALRLAVRKDEAYRQAWREQGYIGNVARILSKASRLRNMVWTDDTPAENPVDGEDETIRDTLLDLANLCAFAAQNMGQGNRWGDRRG